MVYQCKYLIDSILSRVEISLLVVTIEFTQKKNPYYKFSKTQPSYILKGDITNVKGRFLEMGKL